GTLVELVLPGGLPERHHTFAARVTDAIRSSGGGWLVECAFFTPLGEPQVVLLRPAAAHTRRPRPLPAGLPRKEKAPGRRPSRPGASHRHGDGTRRLPPMTGQRQRKTPVRAGPGCPPRKKIPPARRGLRRGRGRGGRHPCLKATCPVTTSPAGGPPP